MTIAPVEADGEHLLDVDGRERYSRGALLSAAEPQRAPAHTIRRTPGALHTEVVA